MFIEKNGKLICILFFSSFFVNGITADSSEEDEFSLVSKTGVLNSRSLLNPTSLKELELKDCNYQTISTSTFSAAPKLRKLEIERTKIDVIPEGVFQGCHNLREIKIKQSTIGKLHKSTFANLTNLRELDIEKTEIGDLKDNMFYGSHKLKEFKCEGCGIANIESGTLNGLIHLEELKLKDNKIAKFSFANLPVIPNLKTVDLSGNPLTTIDVDQIKEKCPKLKELKLKGVTVKPELAQELQKLHIKVKI